MPVTLLTILAVALALWLGHRIGWRTGAGIGYALGQSAALDTLREAAKRWERKP